MFNKPILDLNIDQLRLIEWLDFYSKIDEMGEERPQRYIIDDDYLLDDHLRRHLQKRKADNRKARSPKPHLHKQHQNVYEF